MTSRTKAASTSTRAGILVVAAILIAGIGIGGRAAAPSLATTECWQLGGEDGVAIRLICAGETDIGGQCAALVDGSESELSPVAAACAAPALALQKASMGAVAGVSLGLAGLLLLPVLLARGTRREDQAART